MKSHILQPLGWILLAAVAALIVWLIAGPIADVALTVAMGGMPPMDITPISVVMASVLSGLVAWGLLLLLQRYLRNGKRIWMIVAVVVLVLSMAGPLTAEASTATKAVLMLMHVLVGATLVVGLPRAVANYGATRQTGRGHAARSAADLNPG
ncbi:DUF6069 family protein [Arthrobacter sp. HLT1-21]